MPDWKKIKAEYIRGGVSYRKLAEKHGVSPSTLSKKAMKEKWADLRTQTGKKIDMKISDSVAGREAKRADMFQTIADKLLQQISNGIDDGSIALTGRGYRDITGALKDLREIKGLKNELDMQEQIARIEKLRKEAAAEQENKDIRVVIEPELDDFSE